MVSAAPDDVHMSDGTAQEDGKTNSASLARDSHQIPDTPPEWVGWNKIEETQWIKGSTHSRSCRRDKHGSDWTGEQKGHVFKHERHHWLAGSCDNGVVGRTREEAAPPQQSSSSSV
jgi:hypothetical protein